MNKRIIVIIAVIVVAVAGYFGYQRYFGSASAANNELGGSGTIETTQIAITPQTSGRIIEAPPNEGLAVKAGDVLYRLDPTSAEYQVAQAKSGEKAASVNYTHVKNDSGSDSAQRAAAKAQYQQAVIAVKMAQTQAGYTVIGSPIDGAIASVVAKVGENAVPGSTMAVVSDPKQLTVNIYVPENRIGEVKVGHPGTLTTDSTSSYKVEVSFVGSQAEFTPASIETKDQRVKLVYQVKCRIIDPDSSLKAGMPADVVLR
jgi:multidrug resistance efflux pump